MTGAAASRFSRSSYFGSPSRQAEPPAVIVDHDGDVIRIVESRRAAIERGVVEVPLRRSELPDQLRKVVPVFVVAGAAAFGGEIKLVPPLQLGLRRQRHLAGFLAADQIAAHRHHGLAALRPKRGDDVGRPRAPIEAGEGRLLDLERIHQGDGVDGDRRRLAVADRVARKKARRAIAAQIRHDHPVARRRQQRRDIDKAVNVVGPAVQKNDRRDHRRDRLRRIRHSGRRHRSASAGANEVFVPGLIAGSRLALSCRVVPAQNRSCRAERRQWSSRQRQRRRRRSWSISSAILIVSIGKSPWFDGYAADQPNVKQKPPRPDRETRSRTGDRRWASVVGSTDTAAVRSPCRCPARQRQFREPRLAAVRRSARGISRTFPALPGP